MLNRRNLGKMAATLQKIVLMKFFLNEQFWIMIEYLLNFAEWGFIVDRPASVKTMAYSQTRNKSLP